MTTTAGFVTWLNYYIGNKTETGEKQTNIESGVRITPNVYIFTFREINTSTSETFYRRLFSLYAQNVRILSYNCYIDVSGVWRSSLWSVSAGSSVYMKILQPLKKLDFHHKTKQLKWKPALTNVLIKIKTIINSIRWLVHCGLARFSHLKGELPLKQRSISCVTAAEWKPARKGWSSILLSSSLSKHL